MTNRAVCALEKKVLLVLAMWISSGIAVNRRRERYPNWLMTDKVRTTGRRMSKTALREGVEEKRRQKVRKRGMKFRFLVFEEDGRA